MYCKKCGKFLTGDENYCSNCGIRLEKDRDGQEVETKKSEQETFEQTDEKKLKPPAGIDWDLSQFSDRGANSKDGDMEFHWETEGMFKRSELKEKQIETGESDGNTTDAIDEFLKDRNEPEEIELPNIDYSELFKKLEFPGKEILGSASNPESETGDNKDVDKAVDLSKHYNVELEAEKEKIDKFYTFSSKKEEFQKLLDREYEKMRDKEEPGNFEDDFKGFMEIHTEPLRENTTQAEAMVKAREKIFGSGNEGLNPEFLDEVERAKLLGEEKIEAIADRVGAVNKEGSDHGREFDTEESKVESVAFAPTTLTVDETGENNNKPVESILSEDENSSEKHNTVSIVIDPKNEDRETEEPTAKKEELNSFFEEEPQRKGLKIFLGFLWVIIILVAALLVFRFVMPDNIISRYIDMGAEKIWSYFDGGDKNLNNEASEESKQAAKNISEDRSSVATDKSRLINAKYSNNYREIIEKIKSNESLKLDRSFGKSRLRSMGDIENNLMSKDSKGDRLYYDEELVGAVISLEAQRGAYLKNNDQKVFNAVDGTTPLKGKLVDEKNLRSDEVKRFKTLEIGDIKTRKNKEFYIYTRSNIDGRIERRIYIAAISGDAFVFTDFVKLKN